MMHECTQLQGLMHHDDQGDNLKHYAVLKGLKLLFADFKRQWGSGEDALYVEWPLLTSIFTGCTCLCGGIQYIYAMR